MTVKQDDDELTLRQAAHLREAEHFEGAQLRALAEFRTRFREVHQSYARLQAQAAEYGMDPEELLNE